MTIGKTLAVMALLALGAAHAAGTTPAGGVVPAGGPAGGTAAGTPISNQATVTYNDASGTAVPNPPPSNTVVTTISSVAVFDITANDSAADSGPHPSTPGQTKTDVVPGQTVYFPYTINNYGNTPVQVTLSTIYSLGGAVSTGSNIDPAKVKYYLDADNSGSFTAGDTPITSGTVLVPNNAAGTASVKIIQEYVVPDTATPGSRVGADVIGAGLYASGGASSTTYDTTVPVAGSAAPYLNQDANNFNQVTLYSPVLTNNPRDGDPATPLTIDPLTSTVTPPGGTAVPGYPAPGDPASPGTTPIVQGIAGNEQRAYPPADSDVPSAVADVVRFTNTVINRGTLADTVRLFPTDATGAPIGTNTGGVFSAVPGLPAGTTVQFLDTAGTALPLVGGYPTLSVAAGNQASYVTKITYPDSDSSPLPVITVTVGIDSGNDAGVVADGASKNTIYPPSALFGDLPAAASTPNPALTPNVAVVPGTPATGQTDTANDNRAVYPMGVSNTGTYPESYTLTGSVTVPLRAGGTQTLTVSYYNDVNNSGTLDAGDSLLSGGTTAVVAAGGLARVLAVVDVPASTLSDGLAKSLSQTATGTVSGLTRTDANDTLTVGISGALDVKKFADNCGPSMSASGAALTASCTPLNHAFADAPAAASAKPADHVRYQLLAQNNTNASVQSVILSDDFAVGDRPNLTLVSLGASTTVTGAKVLYRLSGGAWTPITGTVALPANTSGARLDFWYDGNGNGAADASTADALPLGGGFTVTINTVVK